ncbi:MAG: hypothetical protein AAF401_01270 [Pseudomonadota bacterium]
MANQLAIAALLGWPVIGAIIFAINRDRVTALAITLVVGYAFLPANFGFDLTGLPAMGKSEIVIVTALLVLLAIPSIKKQLLPKSVVMRVCIVVLLLSPTLTMLTNTQGYYVGPKYLPGMGFADILALTSKRVFEILPFFFGLWLMRSPASHATFLRVMMIVGAVYAFLMLVEIRLAPQLHIWVYGYFPHSFAQQIRGSGFRPVVFMGHGLLTTFFLMTTILAAAVIWRTSLEKGQSALTAIGRQQQLYISITLSMLIVLLLSRSLGSQLFAAILAPVALLASSRTQLTVAVMLAALVLFYPLVRIAGVVPLEAILDGFDLIDEKRSHSLAVRFANEEMLLGHAKSQLSFGWGNWGRSRIYHPVSGQDLSTTDGLWIIYLGVYGILAVCAFLVFHLTPIFQLWRYVRRERKEVHFVSSGIALILAANAAELLPNSTIFPTTSLLVGALTGYYETLKSEEDETLEVETAAKQTPTKRTVL